MEFSKVLGPGQDSTSGENYSPQQGEHAMYADLPLSQKRKSCSVKSSDKMSIISVARGCSFEALNFMRERSQYIYVKGYVAANQIYRNQPNNVSMNSFVKDCM